MALVIANAVLSFCGGCLLGWLAAWLRPPYDD